MSILNIQLLCRRSIDFPELAIFPSRPGAMINLHWLELPMARTIFHGPKGVRAIEVRLYIKQKSAVCLPGARVTSYFFIIFFLHSTGIEKLDYNSCLESSHKLQGLKNTKVVRSRKKLATTCTFLCFAIYNQL